MKPRRGRGRKVGALSRAIIITQRGHEILRRIAAGTYRFRIVKGKKR